MFVVLCDSFEEAQEGFDKFMNFLEKYEPHEVQNVYYHAYAVQLSGGVRYIFVDKRFKSLSLRFDKIIDYLYLDEFLEGLCEWEEESKWTERSLWKRLTEPQMS